MSYRKYLILLIICLCASHKMTAQQNYRSLCDSCYKLLENKDITTFKRIIPNLYNSFAKENDPYYIISEELENKHQEDQSLRLLYMDAQKNRGTNDKLTKILHQLMKDTDKENAIYAKSVLQKYGWLTTDEVSEKANEGLFLIIQHCEDTEVQALCLSLLKEKLKDYPNERWHYAFLVDRFAMNQGREQTYGTQKIVKKGFPYPVPLMYPEKIDSLREEMGLGSLWQELNEEYGSDWSLEKYLSKEKEVKKVFQDYINNK